MFFEKLGKTTLMSIKRDRTRAYNMNNKGTRGK